MTPYFMYEITYSTHKPTVRINPITVVGEDPFVAIDRTGERFYGAKQDYYPTRGAAKQAAREAVRSSILAAQKVITDTEKLIRDYNEAIELLNKEN